MIEVMKSLREEPVDADAAVLSLGTLAIVGIVFVMLVAVQRE
jgi:hypothetical protein